MWTLFGLKTEKPDLQPEIPAAVVLAALDEAQRLRAPLTVRGMRRILQAAESAGSE